MTATPLEPRHLRSCLSRFVTGVAVVSYVADGEARGVTVNSFTSVSMDPPLILVSLARSAKACAHLSAVPFTINVLKASQLDVAMQFAGRPRAGLNVNWQHTEDGLAPALAGALATFRCRPWQTYDGGDHILQLGEVVQADVTGEEEPLLFDRGRFAMVGLSLFDNPRVIEADPVVGGGIVRSNLVHHLATAV
jgi:flavin reductase (DIM6/NTAB) family NADH-FMN oxidoreductase RutF